jgi:hypothetical protein
MSTCPDERHTASIEPNLSSLSANLRRYSISALVSMTGNGGDLELSTMTGYSFSKISIWDSRMEE